MVSVCSGVTAASIIGVANASQGAGAHFELLGRSTPIESTSAWVDWTDEQLAAEKNALRERLVEASDRESYDGGVEQCMATVYVVS